MQYYKYDENGYFQVDVIADAMPESCTDIRPPQPCWLPCWNGEEWVEEAPPPEHDIETQIAIWGWEAKTWRVEPKPEEAPSLEEQLRDARAALAALGIEQEEVDNDEA